MSSSIENIKNKNNIVEVISEYIDLHKKGKNYWAICPFHEDSNPSMSVSSEKQIYKCFVCGAGGNVINFVSEYQKIPFSKALKILCERSGIEFKNSFEQTPKYTVEQQKIIDALNDANNFFQYSISTKEGEKALAYSEKRGIDKAIMEKFKIGFAPKEGLVDFLLKKGYDKSTLLNASLINGFSKPFFQNKLIFSICNKYGDVIGFSGRKLEGDGPKYINSAESPVFNKNSVLYNIFNASDRMFREKEVIIAEGFMDVIALYKIGKVNAVAIMGTALTQNHIKQLKNIKVKLMLDTDMAGLKASIKSIDILSKNRVPTEVIFNKEGKDVDEILSIKGPEKLLEIIEKSVYPSLKFVYSFLQKEIKPEEPSQIEQFILKFSKYLANSSDIEKEFYVNKMSNDFGFSKDTIMSRIPISLSSYTKLKKNNEIETKNYSYILIRSMLKNPQLIETLKQNPVHFIDSILLSVAKYIIAISDKKNVKIEKDIKIKVQEILNESNEIVKTKNEFLDLIKIINQFSKNDFLKSFENKINNSSEKSERIKYLNQIKKIQKMKRGKND